MTLPARFARIAVAVAAKVGAPFWQGVVLIDGTPGGIDDNGNFVPGLPPTEIPARVQINAMSEAMRVQAGFADGDYQFVILRDGLGVSLNTDAKVSITDTNAPAEFQGTWLVASLTIDPAAIGYIGKGRKA